MQNSKIFWRQYPRTLVLVEGKGGEERRKFVFVLQKCTETVLQQCRINNFSGDYTPEPRFRGEEVCFCSSKMF